MLSLQAFRTWSRPLVSSHGGTLSYGPTSVLVGKLYCNTAGVSKNLEWAPETPKRIHKQAGIFHTEELGQHDRGFHLSRDQNMMLA